MQIFRVIKCAFVFFLTKNLVIYEKMCNFAHFLCACMQLMYVILLTIGLVLAAMVFLSVRVIFKRNGRFKSMHISDSKAMRERGIGCVQSQDRQMRNADKKKIKVNEL